MVEDNKNTRTEVELLKRDMELFGGLASKFDIAIDRLSEVSINIEKMLAVHESRLQTSEKQSEITHQRITEFKKEVTSEVKALRTENAKAHNEVTQRLDKLERWRWFVVGVASVIGFLLAQATNLANIF